MKLKIDALRVLAYNDDGTVNYERSIRESDWLRVMAVVRATIEDEYGGCACEKCVAVRALRGHLEKRK